LHIYVNHLEGHSRMKSIYSLALSFSLIQGMVQDNQKNQKQNTVFAQYVSTYLVALRPRPEDERKTLIQNTSKILLVDGINSIYAQSLPDGIQRYTLIKKNEERIVAEKSLATQKITCKLSKNSNHSESLPEHYFDVIQQLIETQQNKQTIKD
jgi:hypothetical protein